MLIYHYKAYDNKGKLHEGNLFISDEEEAIAFLLRQGLTPIQVKLISQSLISNFLFRLFFRITFSQKLYLLRSLYLILKSGLTLDKGLEILMKESKGGVKDFLFYLNYNLQRGEPLYKTFAAFPAVFSQAEIETIKSGEISGNLIANLEKLAENLERQREIKNEIVSNIIYPAIVLFLSLGVLIILITFVMPKISILLNQLPYEKPFLTRVLINISDFANNNLFFIITFLVLFLLGFILSVSLKPIRRFLFQILMKLPFFSDLYFALSLSQSFFILRSLLSAGITLHYAFKLTADSLSNNDLKQSFYNIEKELKSGKKLGDALLLQEKIPVFVSSILNVAAEAGFLEETLKVMENYYLETFRTKVRNLLNLLQPALLIFVGLIVGFVAIAVLVPIYQQISQQLQPQEGREVIPGQLK